MMLNENLFVFVLIYVFFKLGYKMSAHVLWMNLSLPAALAWRRVVPGSKRTLIYWLTLSLLVSVLPVAHRTTAVLDMNYAAPQTGLPRSPLLPLWPSVTLQGDCVCFSD